MTENETPETTIAKLREQVAEARKSRMAAQRTVATSPVLEVALQRASRDRSSGATNETDTLREEIELLRDDIAHEVRQIDRVRTLLVRADAVYPGLPQRSRLVNELNHEAQWRNDLMGDERWTELRLDLPQAEEFR